VSVTTGSLRTKLVLWFALVFLAIDAGLVTALAIVRGESFEALLMADVREWTRGLAASITVDEPDWTPENPATEEELEFYFPLIPSFDHEVFPAGVVLRHRNGAIIGSARIYAPGELPMSLVQGLVQGPILEVVTEISAEDSLVVLGVEEEHTLLTMPIYRLDPNRIEYIQVVVPQAVLTPSLTVFANIIILGIVIGGAFSVLAAWVVARHIVAPIEQLALAARGLHPDRIGERIRVDTSNSEMAELQRELNEALARLELGFRGQERFIGDVSHELRTPLAVLLAEAGLLNPEKTNIARYRSFVSSTEEELRRLARLVDGFLRLTRVEMTREPLLKEEVEINDLIIDATRNVGDYAKRAGVHLVPNLALPDDEGDGPQVLGDPELLRTMLENLLRNAVRFSPTGAPVSIDVEREAEEVKMIVRDKGPGIPPENLERVFTRFVRLEQRGQQEQGGTGIGLAIARNVAVLHRGSIQASNAVQGGCIMTVSLPMGSGEEVPGDD
jgi:signal transduction histidine kinase